MNGIPKLTQMSQITHTDTADWTQKRDIFCPPQRALDILFHSLKYE